MFFDMLMGKRTGDRFDHYYQIFSCKPHSFPGDCFDGKEPKQKTVYQAHLLLHGGARVTFASGLINRSGDPQQGQR